MTRLCVDTSAYSNFRRGEPRVVRQMDRAEWIGVPSVVVGELWAGFLLGTRSERNVDEFGEFLSHPVVEVIAIDKDVAQLYGEIFVELRSGGRPLPRTISGLPRRQFGRVRPSSTFDRHFQDIARVGAIVL